MKRDITIKGVKLENAIKTAPTSSVLAGKGTALKMLVIEGSRFVQRANPDIEMLGEGRIPHFKFYLLGLLEDDEVGGVDETQAQDIINQVVYRTPISFPNHLRYSTHKSVGRPKGTETHQPGLLQHGLSNFEVRDACVPSVPGRHPQSRHSPAERLDG